MAWNYLVRYLKTVDIRFISSLILASDTCFLLGDKQLKLWDNIALFFMNSQPENYKNLKIGINFSSRRCTGLQVQILEYKFWTSSGYSMTLWNLIWSCATPIPEWIILIYNPFYSYKAIISIQEFHTCFTEISGHLYIRRQNPINPSRYILRSWRTGWLYNRNKRKGAVPCRQREGESWN